MQNLKIYKKSPVMRNSALFAVFSILYVHVIESFVGGTSTFTANSFILFLENHKILLISFSLFSITLFGGRKFAKYFYILFVLQCIYFAFGQYFIALDKFVLILNFLFLILSYYFYLFMNSDLAEASNTPIANPGDLYSGITINSPVSIKSGESRMIGYFINWDEGTCFLKTDSASQKGHVELSWTFENSHYACEGIVVSSAPDIGIGVRLRQTNRESDIFSWADFYDIIHSRGYSPNLTA